MQLLDTSTDCKPARSKRWPRSTSLWKRRERSATAALPIEAILGRTKSLVVARLCRRQYLPGTAAIGGQAANFWRLQRRRPFIAPSIGRILLTRSIGTPDPQSGPPSPTPQRHPLNLITRAPP